MNELHAIIHHIEQAAKRAGVNFDADCRAECVADVESLVQRLERAERLAGEAVQMVAALLERVQSLEPITERRYYGCVACQRVHYDNDPYFEAHLMRQDKNGLKRITTGRL